jgi:hypothetical protein
MTAITAADFTFDLRGAERPEFTPLSTHRECEPGGIHDALRCAAVEAARAR